MATRAELIGLAADPSTGSAGDRAARALATSLASRVHRRLPSATPRERLDAGCALLGVVSVDYLSTLKASGELRLTPAGPRVLVRDQEVPERQNFTIAHELGHVFMPGRSANSDDPIEQRCDYFASELLMPKRPFLAAYRELLRSGSRFFVKELARTFGASVQSCVVRLADMKALRGSGIFVLLLAESGEHAAIKAAAFDSKLYTASDRGANEAEILRVALSTSNERETETRLRVRLEGGHRVARPVVIRTLALGGGSSRLVEVLPAWYLR